jgi:hypothetical protein
MDWTGLDPMLGGIWTGKLLRLRSIYLLPHGIE